MKALLFFVVAAMLLPFVKAEVQDEQELEKEAEKFQKSMIISDPQKAEAWEKSREQVAAYRLECYEKAAKRTTDGRPIEATNPPECTYYSTEGVCTLPNTRITPYPKIAHVNTLLDFKFPKKLGGCVAQYIQVYGTKELGYSIRYAAPDLDADGYPQTYADVYIYDMPISMVRADLLAVEQVKLAAAEINNCDDIYQNIIFDKNISDGNFENGDKLPYFYFYVQFDAPNHKNVIEKCQSYTMAFFKNRKFVKFRITQRNGTRESFEKFVNGFLDDFDKKVILDSQIRTRKFENAVVYPFVLCAD